MAREWQEVKNYKPEQIGIENLISQSAEGYFERNTLVEGLLTQIYDFGNGPVKYVTKGRFHDGKLIEGRKMCGNTLVNESKLDFARRSIVTSFDPDGNPLKRVFISRTGEWLKTEQYENGRLVYLREPSPTLNITTFREFSPETNRPTAIGFMLWDREIPYPNIFKLKETPNDTTSATLRDTHRKLVYQGEISGFTPHGNGKIYNRNSELIYSGEIQHGMRHGSGVAYGSKDGRQTHIEYEGDFFENEFHGIGKMYDPTGEYVKYEGEWEHGFLIRGTEYLGDTVIYRGEFHGRAADGHYLHHGSGELFHENGAPYFSGMFIYDMFTGDDITVFNSDGVKYYEGDLINGKCGRYGVTYLSDGTILEQRSNFDSQNEAPSIEITHYGSEGIILYNGGADLITDSSTDCMENVTGYVRQGNGTVHYENGERFEGEYKDDQRNGAGTYYYADGKVKFNGSFLMGKYDGECQENRPDGSVLVQGYFENGECVRGEGTFKFDDEEYTGQIDNRLRNGRGELRYPDGKIHYRGGFENDLYSSDGEEYYENGSLKYSGGYKEGAFDGYGLLYSEYGDLIYDGSWDSGSRTGQGKMYFSDGSYYEGGFLNNEKDGQGRDYYPDGQLRYEGEFKSGIENGKGTLYSLEDTKIYEGQWKDGLYNGDGLLYYPEGGLHFSGKFLDGKLHGEASEYDDEGRLRFDGSWENGKRRGSGRVYYKNKESFWGTISDGLKQGQGKYYYADGKLAYEGEYLDNKRHGNGTAYDKDGKLHYRGEWKNGMKDGFGYQYSPEGTLVYEGSYKNGKFHGQGKYYTEDNRLYYEGAFQNGKRDGYGQHYNHNGFRDYDGYYADGLRSGFGISYSPDGEHVTYSGFWSLGKYHGCGVIYLHDQPRYTGMFLDGKMSGRVNEIENGRIVREAIYEDGQMVYQRSYDQADVMIYEGGACMNGLPDGDGISYDGLGNVTFKGKFHHGQPIELGSFQRRTLEPIPEIPELGAHDFNIYRTKSVYKIMGAELESGVRLFCTLENGIPSGMGSAVFRDGRKYFGPFQDGRPTGHGTVSTQDGRKFTGEIYDGFPHGYGVLSMPDGNQYEGEFNSFQRNGSMRMLCAGGELLHAQFRDDVQISHAIQYRFVRQSLSRFPDSIPYIDPAAHASYVAPVSSTSVPVAQAVPLIKTVHQASPAVHNISEEAPDVDYTSLPIAQQYEAVDSPMPQMNTPVPQTAYNELDMQGQIFQNAADSFRDLSVETGMKSAEIQKKDGFKVNINNVSDGDSVVPQTPTAQAGAVEDDVLHEAESLLSDWIGNI